MTQAFIGATYIRNIIVRELAEFNPLEIKQGF